MQRHDHAAVRRRRIARAAFAGACLLVAIAAGLAQAEAQQAAKVTIDVGVFDAHGQPIADLAAGDFTVHVKGQPRKVVSAEFVSANPDDPAATTNEPRRWIVLAVDEASMFAGTERELQDVAARVLDRITPADRVAIVPLPARGDQLTTFTSDANQAQTALSRIAGARLPELLHVDMTFGEALSISEENDVRAYATIKSRACTVDIHPENCIRMVSEAAGMAAVTLQSQAKPVFVGLVQIVDAMREYRGSKTIILLSGGSAISQRWAAVDELAKRAALSEVTVQSVLVEPREQARGRLVVQNQLLDRKVFMQRLELVSHAARGAVYRAEKKDAATVLDRLMQETTGFYRLEIEPQPADAGEVIPNAAISIARKDVTVRARPMLLRGMSAAGHPPTDSDTGNAASGAASASGGARSGGGAVDTTATGADLAVGPAGLTSLAMTLVPAFARDQVLAPPVLGVFLDQLVARTPKPSALLTQAVARAKTGDLAGAASPSTLADLAKVDAPAAAFLRGLSLFAQPSVEALEAAAVQFRETLRDAPDFYPAAFYLGACYAAGHRDREAAGAWQTALITLSDVPAVYLVLSDALLRLQDAGRASDFLDEAAGHWPQDVAWTKRRVPAALLSGRAADALATIDRLPSPIDTDTLFAGICLLHDALLARRPIVSEEEDRRRLQRYADAYRAANGPRLADVTRLIAEITPH